MRFSMGESGVAEMFVRLVQEMYETSMKVVKCTVGVTLAFKVEVGVHQGSAPEPLIVCYSDGQNDQ